MIGGAVDVVVVSVLSQLENGCIFTANLADGSALRVKYQGKKFRPEVGETYQIDGNESPYTDKFGRPWRQFDVKSVKRSKTIGALLRPWLEDMPNVGSSRAKRLVEKFGVDLVAVLADASRMAEVAEVLDPIKKTLANTIAAQIFASLNNKLEEENSAKAEGEFLTSLERAGVNDASAARRLWRLVGGEGSKERLMRNPYLAASIIPWAAADMLGKKLLVASGDANPVDNHPDRLLGAVDSCWREILADGNTAATPNTFKGLLLERNVDSDAALVLAMNKRAVLVFDGILRAPGAAYLEDRLAAKLRELENAVCSISIPEHDRLLSIVHNAELSSGLQLSSHQRDAVLGLFKTPVGLLQGGAGVGKTTVMKVLIAAWEAMGGNTVMGAVAGKAALQLSRGASSPSKPRLAYTVARMIRMLRADTDGTSASNSNLQFNDCTMLILDEASMLDTPGLRELTIYLPIGARIVMVGDQGQLPPIGLGCVFHNLVAQGSRVTSLTEVRRQAVGSPIPMAAEEVRSGQVPALTPWSNQAHGIFIAPKSTHFLSLYSEVSKNEKDVMVVAARRKTVVKFNEQASMARRDDETKTVRLGPMATVAVGDPVVCTRNRYADGLFNGLLGRVDAIDPLNQVHVLWDGETEARKLDAEAGADIELAYAITCHRAQGSSATTVIVIVEDSPLVTREWLYTAITRAKETVVLVADADALAGAVQRRTQRCTGFQI